jgi:glucosamine-6-phosphate deaminase
MKLVIHGDHEKASLWTANYIAEKINSAGGDKPFVLGLPTGSSPKLVYRELIKTHKDGKLSFKNVRTFNMDEYIGLSKDHPQSYHYYMAENFFNHIDIDPEHTHILDGTAENPEKECELYERAIAGEGGIDLFLGGMGGNGHIAFNEPGSSLTSRTRVVTLAEETRKANSRFFGSDITKVPHTAITVGVGTVMDSREVVIIVSGRNKAGILKTVTEGEVSSDCPLSCLQNHPNATIVCDEEAAGELKS